MWRVLWKYLCALSANATNRKSACCTYTHAYILHVYLRDTCRISHSKWWCIPQNARAGQVPKICKRKKMKPKIRKNKKMKLKTEGSSEQRAKLRLAFQNFDMPEPNRTEQNSSNATSGRWRRPRKIFIKSTRNGEGGGIEGGGASKKRSRRRSNVRNVY